MDIITETVTSPTVSVPVGGITIAAGLVTTLPVIINLIVSVYFTLMVIHKLYQMRKEWKEDRKRKNASCE